MDTSTGTIKFFAYGTIRKNNPLHSWIQGGIISELGQGYIEGAKLYFPSDHTSYPYLVQTNNPSDKAIGELYEMAHDSTFDSMLRMESNAGYTPALKHARTHEGTHEVVVCLWEHMDEIGNAVPDNDWSKR